MEGPDDRDLIRAYIRGDKASFDVLYRRYRDGLFRFVYFSVKDSDSAADLVQKIFLKVIERPERFRSTSREHFRRWLYRSAINLCRDEFRKKENRSVDRGIDLEGLPARTPADGSDPAIERSVWNAVEGLPEKYRRIIGLFYFSDMTYENIARTLGVPVGTVRSRMNTAMKLLSTRLKELKNVVRRDH